jgi:hypothetical protein
MYARYSVLHCVVSIAPVQYIGSAQFRHIAEHKLLNQSKPITDINDCVIEVTMQWPRLPLLEKLSDFFSFYDVCLLHAQPTLSSRHLHTIHPSMQLGLRNCHLGSLTNAAQLMLE